MTADSDVHLCQKGIDNSIKNKKKNSQPYILDTPLKITVESVLFLSVKEFSSEEFAFSVCGFLRKEPAVNSEFYS